MYKKTANQTVCGLLSARRYALTKREPKQAEQVTSIEERERIKYRNGRSTEFNTWNVHQELEDENRQQENIKTCIKIERHQFSALVPERPDERCDDHPDDAFREPDAEHGNHEGGDRLERYEF